MREDSRRGVFVEGARESRPANYREAVLLLLAGDKMRRMASTNMNQESSRSHVIFTVIVESCVKEEGVVKTRKSKINIVDLAGSERLAS